MFSLTALAVALARGAGRDAPDRCAASLVPAPFDSLLSATRGLPNGALSVLTLGLTDHLRLRTLAIDAAIDDATAARAQLVLLGAGLDARAYRLPCLQDTHVFEVDHPSTQALKRTRASALSPSSASLRHVTVDFERDSLGDVLGAAGHRCDQPTLWVWEGVTPYLRVDAIRATLDTIAARSARGSRLLLTYGTTDMTPLGVRVGRLALRGFSLLGERIRSLFAPNTMRDELRRVGFRVLDDTAPRDWARRFDCREEPWLLVDEHLVVAEKIQAIAP